MGVRQTSCKSVAVASEADCRGNRHDQRLIGILDIDPLPSPRMRQRPARYSSPVPSGRSWLLMLSADAAAAEGKVRLAQLATVDVVHFYRDLILARAYAEVCLPCAHRERTDARPDCSAYSQLRQIVEKSANAAAYTFINSDLLAGAHGPHTRRCRIWH